MTDADPASPFDRDAVCERVLTAALAHIPFDGWTIDALQRGAEDAGHPRIMAVRVFPRGAVDAVEFWCALADRRMAAALVAHDPTSLKVRARIALAVRLRLEALAGHREAVRRAVGLLALPHNAGSAARTLWRTIDAIWYAAGDTATDFNYYTKRALLAGVYGATLLYWLDDRSEGSAETWTFLDRRIGEALSVPRKLSEIGARLGALPNPFRRFGFGAPFRR